jgi:hypothetical protein
VGLERGQLSLVITTEELLGRKSSGSGLEIWEFGRRDPSRWPRGTLYPQNLALLSPTSDGRSVVIVRWRTQNKEFIFVCLLEGLHCSEILSNIGMATLGRNSDITIGRAACEAYIATCHLCSNWAFSVRQENHSKVWLSWSVAWWRLTSSQQSSIKYVVHNISSYLCCCLIWKKSLHICFWSFSFYVHNMDEQQTVVYLSQFWALSIPVFHLKLNSTL